MSQIRLQSENDSSNSRCGWAASYLLRLSSQHAASTPRLPVPRHPRTLQGPGWALHAQATRVGSSSTASSRAGETAREKKTVPFPAAASLFLPLPCSVSTRYPADHTAGNHGPSHVCFVPRGGPRDKPAAGSHTQHPLPSVLPVLPAGSLVTPPEERDTRLSCSRVRRGTAHRASAQETAAPRATRQDEGAWSPSLSFWCLPSYGLPFPPLLLTVTLTPPGLLQRNWVPICSLDTENTIPTRGRPGGSERGLRTRRAPDPGLAVGPPRGSGQCSSPPAPPTEKGW